jgi:hypothetical protein
MEESLRTKTMFKRFLFALALSLAATCPAWAATTTFLESPGTNGFVVTPFNLQSTELNALASGACATSSVGGTSGVFSQANAAVGGSGAIWGSTYFTSGGAFTPVVGQALYGWFLLSPDGGTTFETQTATCSTTVPPLPRGPDFVIPLSNAAYASGNDAWVGGRFVQLPFESYKVVIWNTAGGAAATALPATGNLVKTGPAAIINQ